jgi:hypothetical protein
MVRVRVRVKVKAIYIPLRVRGFDLFVELFLLGCRAFLAHGSF